MKMKILQCSFLLIAVCAAAGPTDPTEFHVTGNLTRETLRIMEQPRCGNKDIMDNDEEQNGHVTVNGVALRQKRSLSWDPGSWLAWIIGRKDWEAKDFWGNLIYTPGSVVKYSVDRLPSDDIPDKQRNWKLSDAEVNSIIDDAFAICQEHTNLQFQRTSSGGAISIGFFSKDHSLYSEDCVAFDGERGVAAHAMFPRDGSAIHFDNEERWVKFNLTLTAVHEIGHAIGLRDSVNRAAIMSGKLILNRTLGVQLHPEDINRIQALYGVPPGGRSHSLTY